MAFKAEIIIFYKSQKILLPVEEEHLCKTEIQAFINRRLRVSTQNFPPWHKPNHIIAVTAQTVNKVVKGKIKAGFPPSDFRQGTGTNNQQVINIYSKQLKFRLSRLSKKHSNCGTSTKRDSLTDCIIHLHFVLQYIQYSQHYAQPKSKLFRNQFIDSFYFGVLTTTDCFNH